MTIMFVAGELSQTSLYSYIKIEFNLDVLMWSDGF